MEFGDRNKYVDSLPYFTKEDCPFCILAEDEKKLLIYESKYWQVRFNKFPYYGYKQNLLAIPKKHKTFTTELTEEELEDFKNIEQYMKDFFGDKNYFSFIRQGTGGRSIEHLHYHYLEGEIFHDTINDDKTFKIKNVSEGKK